MRPDPSIVRLTNCRVALNGGLVWQDLWLSSTTGKILDPQVSFFSQNAEPSVVHDLGGRVVAPGFLDVQINGGWGFDFSVPSEQYSQDLDRLNKELVKTGVTSYVPTLTSQKSEVYHQVPYLTSSGRLPHILQSLNPSSTLSDHPPPRCHHFPFPVARCPVPRSPLRGAFYQPFEERHP